MVAHIVLDGAFAERALAKRWSSVPGKHGEAVAAALELAPIREASDDIWRTWGTAKDLVLESDEATIIAPSTDAKLAAALRAIQK